MLASFFKILQVELELENSENRILNNIIKTNYHKAKNFNQITPNILQLNNINKHHHNPNLNIQDNHKLKLRYNHTTKVKFQ